ncbi:hypothetical protein FQA39_LY16949 [Lamprigera yunnana]|nr:hypothetical protein FQA39_LY16949 [Lamprigera yunnana]
MENEIKPCFVVLESTPLKQMGLSAELHKEIKRSNILTTRIKQKVLQDLNTLQTTDNENSQKLHRNKITIEILSTEVTFINKLQILIDYFMTPIQNKRLLSKENYYILFDNIKIIYNIHKALLQEFRNDNNIVDAFLTFAPFLKTYSFYAYHYKQILELLQSISTKDAAFAKFLHMQESRPEVQCKLSALLITPIQRVPRYCLLLRQLLDNTSPTHRTYLNLKELLKKVEASATHINSLLENQENTQQMLEFQRSLICGYPVIVKPGRKLLKKGLLTILYESKNKKRERYFALLSDILMYCKLKKNDINSPNSLECLGIFPLNKCKIKEDLSKGAFTIICEDEKIVVYHEHAHDAEDWVKVIKDRIKEYIHERRTLRKDSSARRPAVHKRALNEYQDVGISPGVPRKKRLLQDHVTDDNIENNSEDKRKCCFLMKRKPIRNDNGPSSSKIKTMVVSQQDCLFPLRELQKSNDAKEITGETFVKSGRSDETNKVFIFGANNQRRSFGFSMFNVLAGLGNSFKRLFGIRQ